MVKRILKILAVIVGVILLLVIGLIAFLSVTEYMPEDRQPADEIILNNNGIAADGDLTLYSWNIGYAGLGEESDFFMDGGEMVDPPSQEIVEKNFAGILSVIENNPADAWLLQEIDLNSARTDSLNEFAGISEIYGTNAAFAYNYKCPFVPIPMPPMGRVESGIATVTPLAMSENAERVSLPCPFSWPVRAANLKRCLLVTRMDIENSDKELVLVNLHLEAYESGEGRIAQTKMLMELIKEEYGKGNYVIAGGDFNQAFPGTLDTFPIEDPEKWNPNALDEGSLPEGWQLAYDGTSATCRLLDRPYCDECQLYVIDGFILSPNVQLNSVKTVPLDFEYSDHNPVCLNVSLINS